MDIDWLFTPAHERLPNRLSFPQTALPGLKRIFYIEMNANIWYVAKAICIHGWLSAWVQALNI